MVLFSHVVYLSSWCVFMSQRNDSASHRESNVHLHPSWNMLKPSTRWGASYLFTLVFILKVWELHDERSGSGSRRVIRSMRALRCTHFHILDSTSVIKCDGLVFVRLRVRTLTNWFQISSLTVTVFVALYFTSSCSWRLSGSDQQRINNRCSSEQNQKRSSCQNTSQAKDQIPVEPYRTIIDL